jgi:hypothetical protein
MEEEDAIGMVDQLSFIEEATEDQWLLRLYRYRDERRGGQGFPGAKRH